MLMVSDNGIGMNRDDLVEQLGTIARSGTSDFLQGFRKSKDQELSLDLIGQFGVGFYSSFMVASKVTVITRRAGENTAHKWESTGQGDYTIEETERPSNGTTVILHLQPVDQQDGIQDYTAEWVLKDIVRHYSDFDGSLHANGDSSCRVGPIVSDVLVKLVEFLVGDLLRRPAPDGLHRVQGFVGSDLFGRFALRSGFFPLRHHLYGVADEVRIVSDDIFEHPLGGGSRSEV